MSRLDGRVERGVEREGEGRFCCGSVPSNRREGRRGERDAGPSLALEGGGGSNPSERTYAPHRTAASRRYAAPNQEALRWPRSP
jgi:hypothetical protein